MKATDFPKGARVCYTAARRLKADWAGYAGRIGIVIRPIKTRDTVHLFWQDDPDGTTFEAKAHNLKLTT